LAFSYSNRTVCLHGAYSDRLVPETTSFGLVLARVPDPLMPRREVEEGRIAGEAIRWATSGRLGEETDFVVVSGAEMDPGFLFSREARPS
jgi:hypothetical protein